MKRGMVVKARLLEESEKTPHLLDAIRAQVEAARAIEMAKPLPRNRCPGCFLAIYEGAAEQGWCTDCWPQRKQYMNNVRNSKE